MDMTVPEAMTLIGAVAGATVGIINAWRLKKVDKVMNGNFAKQKDEVERLQRHLNRIRRELSALEEDSQ